MLSLKRLACSLFYKKFNNKIAAYRWCPRWGNESWYQTHAGQWLLDQSLVAAQTDKDDGWVSIGRQELHHMIYAKLVAPVYKVATGVQKPSCLLKRMEDICTQFRKAFSADGFETLALYANEAFFLEPFQLPVAFECEDTKSCQSNINPLIAFKCGSSVHFNWEMLGPAHGREYLRIVAHTWFH